MENEDKVVETTIDTSVDESVTLENKALKEKIKDLESLIVKHKKKDKVDTTETWFTKSDVEKLLSERDFYAKNPEFNEYKAQLSEYTSKWVSIEEASILVKTKDETFANRQKTDSMDITTSDWNPTKTSYTNDDLKSLSQVEYNKVIEMAKAWKVSLK